MNQKKPWRRFDWLLYFSLYSDYVYAFHCAATETSQLKGRAGVEMRVSLQKQMRHINLFVSTILLSKLLKGKCMSRADAVKFTEFVFNIFGPAHIHLL